MENNHNIEDLVAEKDFDQLSDYQKEMVLRELGTEEAYTEMRNFVLTFKDEAEEEAPAAMRKNIMDAFDAHHKDSDKKIIALWKPQTKAYKQPLIYLLLAASLLFAVYIFLPDSNGVNKPQLAENKSKKEISSDTAPKTERKYNTESEPAQIEEDSIEKKTPSSSSVASDETIIETDISESEVSEDTKSPDLDFELNEIKRVQNEDQITQPAPTTIKNFEAMSDSENISPSIQSEDGDVMEITNKENKNTDRIQSLESSISKKSRVSQVKSETVNTISFRIRMLQDDHYTAY